MYSKFKPYITLISKLNILQIFTTFLIFRKNSDGEMVSNIFGGVLMVYLAFNLLIYFIMPKDSNINMFKIIFLFIFSVNTLFCWFSMIYLLFPMLKDSLLVSLK